MWQRIRASGKMFLASHQHANGKMETGAMQVKVRRGEVKYHKY